MGCLNSEGQFEHWFANIHFSGPCNRACYFCIGQHMMGLDPINNLDTWPLAGLDKFVAKCKEKGVKEVNLTGSDTDPMMYVHLEALCEHLRAEIPGVKIGVRTNGVLTLRRSNVWELFNKVSISITSFDPELYRKTMGLGAPPDIESILAASSEEVQTSFKVNVVLCPETLTTPGEGYDSDFFRTLHVLKLMNIPRINVREPYGQPHIGDPMADVFGWTSERDVFGMPSYRIGPVTWATYWDVHYVEVESINLYANGVVSETYPVTKGYHPKLGKVEGQEHFDMSGRQQVQWVKTPKIRLPLFEKD